MAVNTNGSLTPISNLDQKSLLILDSKYPGFLGCGKELRKDIETESVSETESDKDDEKAVKDWDEVGLSYLAEPLQDDE